MSEDNEKALREKIDTLVAKLPAGLVYALLSEIEHMDAQPHDRVKLVRSYVIDYLNRQRPNRSRRLFTSLFEGFLIDDEALFHAGQPVPYAIQRADIGALWDALSREAFPLLAVQCQETLDLMASEELLDRALRSPVALELREQMRAGSIRYLKQAFANRKLLEGFVAELTRNRTRRSKLLSAHINRSPPVSAETLQGILTVLEQSGNEIADVIARLGSYDIAPGQSDEQLEATADLLSDDGNGLALTGGGDAVAALLELSVLNVRQAYALTGCLLRRREVGALRADPLAAGLVGHFLGVCRALTAVLMGVLRLNERVTGAAVRPSARDRVRIDTLLERLRQLVTAVAMSGLRDDRLTEPQFLLAWEMVSKTINARVAAVALERASLAASARKQPVSDHADVVWLVGLVQRWHDISIAFGFDAFDLVKWRETLLDEMRANTDKAMRFEDNENLDERLAQLLRIDGFCHLFGQSPADWVAPSSHNMTRLMIHRLQDPIGLTAVEHRLIAAVLGHVREEVSRSRYWKSHELVQLIELGEQRLVQPVVPDRVEAEPASPPPAPVSAGKAPQRRPTRTRG